MTPGCASSSATKTCSSATGHIPGAVKIDWHADLNDPVQRDYVDGEAFARLMREKGIGPDTTVVFYGDENNWWATYSLWVFRLFGHEDVRVMDGGRKKWEDEDRPMTTEVAEHPTSEYPVPERDDEPIRAFRDGVLEHVRGGGQLIDVRSPEEYRGERLHMADYPQEGAMRGGGTSPARRTSHGRGRRIRRRASSAAPTSSGRSMRRRLEPLRRTRRSRTAASASDPPTRGSCSPTC